MTFTGIQKDNILEQTYLSRNRRFDKIIDGTLSDAAIACGPSALVRAGLTSLCMNDLFCWTDEYILSGVGNGVVKFLYNPIYKKIGFADLKCSPFSVKILEPTRERAILEYMAWIDYFHEGYLIEALQDYMGLNSINKLYESAPTYGVNKDVLDYWIKEAREDNFTVGA